MMVHRAWCVLAALVVTACGGEDPAPAGTPAVQPPRGPQATALAESGAADSAAADSAAAAEREMQLMRERFAYRGAARDPFLSLLRSGAIRPLLDDLRVTTITYNHQYPSNSIAVLRDTTQSKVYTVRSGDQLGRLRIVQIREEEVVVVFDEFGVERQEVLRLRRRVREDL